VKNVLGVVLSAVLAGWSGVSFAASSELMVPVNRSELLTFKEPVAEVSVANPDIADVYVHGATRLSINGKRVGKTTVRVLDENNNTLRDMLVYVTYDLPAIRESLHQFFPNEQFGVQMVNENIALTGDVMDPISVDRAIQIVSQFVNGAQQDEAGEGAGAGAAVSGGGENKKKTVMNMTSVRSGQQVMLRVRIGEIRRSTLKKLGVNLQQPDGAAGLTKEVSDSTDLSVITALGSAAVAGNAGLINLAMQTATSTFSATLDALEQNGLLKILAEPNLVAMSGEKAEFVAGGEFPVPSVEEGSNGNADKITIEFRKYGVSVQFTPLVLSANRIRLVVQPEVTEPGDTAFEVAGYPIRNLSTRKVNTTVELAPGESFMLAGLIRDSVNAKVTGLPGVSEVPILSSMFRTNSFEREETELVIAVTPYMVDPMAGGDVRLPTDGFQEPSLMDMAFYGALSAVSDRSIRESQAPLVEGAAGFMMD
jgi:pilus assembly protein CpaC